MITVSRSHQSRRARSGATRIRHCDNARVGTRRAAATARSCRSGPSSRRARSPSNPGRLMASGAPPLDGAVGTWDARGVSDELHTDRGPEAVEGLLEREVELAALRELFEGAGRGRGGLALVEGSAGVGKSALLGHAAGVARAGGFVVLRARGHELERAF